MSNETPEPAQYVLLKDGTLISCTSKQMQAITKTIIMTPHFSTQKIRLGGRVFKLTDMEHDPSKIANARQQGMPLDIETKKHISTDMG